MHHISFFITDSIPLLISTGVQFHGRLPVRDGSRPRPQQRLVPSDVRKHRVRRSRRHVHKVRHRTGARQGVQTTAGTVALKRVQKLVIETGMYYIR